MRQLFLFILIFISIHLTAQNDTINHWISYSAENDFFGAAVTTDRYYSFCERIDFMKRLKPTYKFEKFLSIRARLEGHTPKYKGKIEEERFRRPFFGYLHTEIRKIKTNSKDYFRYGIDIGISGQKSQAGDYQNWYHTKLINDRFVDGWENQTPDKVGLNLLFDYKRTLAASNHSALRIGSENSLGNIFSYISPTINYQYNTAEVFNYLPFNYSNSKKGNFTLEVEFGYRYEFHNATLQGEYFSHSESYLNDDVIIKGLLVGSIGVNYSIGHFTIYLNNSFNTKRVEENDFHNVGIVGAGWRW